MHPEKNEKFRSPSAPPRDCDEGSPAKSRLALRVSFEAIRKAYSSDEWICIFSDIASRRPLIRLGQSLFEKMRGTPFGVLLISGFGFVSSLRCILPRQASEKLVALQIYPNERVSVDRLASFLPDIPLVRMSAPISHVLTSFVRPKLVLRQVGIFFATYTLLRRLSKEHHFVAICQCSSLLYLYGSFRYQLQTIRPRGVVIASGSLPQPLALRAAAADVKIPSIFPTHAAVPPQGQAIVPKADLVLLDGEASVANCRALGAKNFRYVLWGVPGPSFPMKIPVNWKNELSIGVFLTAPVNMQGLEETLLAIEETLRPRRILLRPHPIAMLTPDLSFLQRKVLSLSVTENIPLHRNIADCDIIFSGNSNVQREVLRSGVPIVFSPNLDLCPPDYVGLVRAEIVPEIAEISEVTELRLRNFYDEGWTRRFRQHDAAYLEEPLATQERTRAEILGFLETFERR